ncbi:FAD-binding domain containing protein [Grosmannia clavigera kw1407]|uniref:FAD-binding domain containing protein n=1 Tax=Grosmannia clavigera (strain kw1407 / UAMH 11150) TaxID=655863 RepID=F0XDZ9_GROCL|nr:FAD-binding domain containing protein [Grosmannia clavigera kw1407]EFX03777.1 FAD-binding domain containing protein [Grosmannia clavigera kw1407]
MSGFLWCILVPVLSAVAVSAHITTCQVVDAMIPGRVIFSNDTIYTSTQSSYYSGEERDLTPDCIFMPTTASEVSQFVKTVGVRKGKDALFAIRGGGHTLWSGAANIEGGITVDMRLINQTVLSADGKIASLGAGARWRDVYPQLTPHNVTVMGGRLGSLGVGGFLSGGGLTFLSRRQGFACDNIYGYEIVLASGEVTYVTEASHAGLWLALKGGSNNFGIITRFDVLTFPSNRMWYSLLQYEYNNTVLEAQAQAFSRFMEPANFDSAAMMGIFIDYVGGAYSITDALWYADDVVMPPVYNGFTEIPNMGGVAELATVADVVDTFGANIPTATSRAFQLDWSFQNPPAEVYMELFQIWEKGISTIADVEGLFIEFLTQPQSVTNGKNLFGLVTGKTNYVVGLLTAAYSNASDDVKVQVAITNIVQAQKKVLRHGSYLIDFVYTNYADGSQGVYQSWGAENVAKLQAVSKEYDPEGIFQTRVPGGFKVLKKS